MANWKATTSSDAAGSLGREYGVFLNFRGEDTRHNFTDFLYDRLVDAGVQTFRDQEKLPHGDVISDRLERAINNSTLYIPIFSRNYASSKWCLRELKLIMDNVSNSGDQKSILPIFLLVNPDDLKFKTRPDSDAPYKAAFEEHEKNFSDDEVKAWKTALEKVDERKGWVVEKNTSQVVIVKSVVREVLKKLKIKRRLVTEHLIGLDDQVKYLMKFLDVNHGDVRLIGIYGMGGIGKTTIAKVVFNQLCSHFGKRCSFLENIQETSINDGIVPLQEKLLIDIGNSESAKDIRDIEEGMMRIGATLSDKEVLVVLDDVDKKVLIKNLIGNSKLSQGSRIIITTRDRDVLQVEGLEVKIERYEMQTMDGGCALQLFCRHAFHKDYPLDDYRELSEEFVSLMGGLPLAVEVVGSLLEDKKDKFFWEKTLVKLREVPKEEILEKLKISYDDLDDSEKEIFLDIACFFFNKKKIDAIYMWESCKFYPTIGIEALTKRCLINILEDEKFQMHDQLIALGRQIVLKDSLGDLEKQSRLWIADDAIKIIRTKKRKQMVKALEVRGPITNENFEGLPNLRFLELNKGTYVGDFARCHSNLRWFSWCFSLEKDFGAENLYLDKLVVCKLHGIDFKDDSKGWDLIKRARDLKVLSITQCSGITTIPDISKCSGLERLTLGDCSSLKRIESFISYLQLLIELKIEWCRDLTDLPKEIGALVKLKHFSLLGCSRLRELPCSIGNLTSLTELDLSGTIIRELPNSIEKLKSLRILRFALKSPDDWLNHNWQLLSGISTLVNLEELDLSSHSVTSDISVGIGELSSLRILNLKCTNICRLPRTINMFRHLQTLNLSHCHKIQELPELPTSLTCLLLQSKSLFSVPDLSNLTNLIELQLSDDSHGTGKSNLTTLCNLKWMGLSKLKRLELNLLNVPAPPELASLTHLEDLTLSCLDLKTLVLLPSSDCSWRNLLNLKISFCEVEDISLNRFPRLEKFTVETCVRLQRLSIHMELGKLRQVKVSDCPELVEIQVEGLSKSLEYLSVYKCKSLTSISGLSNLKNLETLRIERCNVLTNVEGLNELESLESLGVSTCPSLRRLIDASCTKIPDDCFVNIWRCGDSIKDSGRIMPLKRYKEEIILNTSQKCGDSIKDTEWGMFLKHLEEILLDPSEKMAHPFTIDIILKPLGGVSFVTWRKKIYRTPDLVTYEGLMDDVEGFGFPLKRMWYKIPSEDRELQVEIKSDEQVKRMVQLASKRGSILLIVEGGVDTALEGVIIRASQRDSTLHYLAFFFSVAFFLFLSPLRGKLDFPSKIGQLAGMRGFSLCEDSVVIFIFLLFLYFGFKYLGKVQPEILNEEQKDWALWQCQWRENYGSVNGGKTASMEDKKKDKDV